MSKAGRKRERIFSNYARNLEWIKQHPKITMTPDFTDSYVCPLCLDVFGREAINTKEGNYLTIEHNPPKSLGGINEILTCKDCNSKSGHKIDNNLLNRLLELDFLEQKPNSRIRARLDNQGNKVASDFSYTSDGTVHINIDRKNSRPSEADNFLNYGTLTRVNPILNWNSLGEENTFELRFTMSPHLKSNERHAHIALLKIAYLLAFQQFGYGFILNPHLYKVREQILNPDKDILPKVFWLKYDFPQQALGINIINRPAELVCFLVIFNLITPSQQRQYAIALPGPNRSGNQIYENIERILCQDGAGFTQMNLEHLTTKDYTKEQAMAFDTIRYWNSLVPKED